MKQKYLYKFLRTGLKSNSGDCTWKLGEWKHEDTINICNKGFHASKTPLQALGYVGGEILAKVEVKGKSQKLGDKEVWSDMKIVEAWNWTKQDSVALSIYASELCIKNYEKLYPDDKRPREAIEAAKKVLLNDTEENRSAAESAKSAAESAASAAWGAAWGAAKSAAWSAASAAWGAAKGAGWSAAESAEWSAESAAWSAGSAKKKLISSLDKWFEQRITILTKYNESK